MRTSDLATRTEGIFIENLADVTIINSNFDDINSHANGGCVYINSSTLNIESSNFNKCKAPFAVEPTINPSAIPTQNPTFKPARMSLRGNITYLQ